jgi:hypothetical protein
VIRTSKPNVVCSNHTGRADESEVLRDQPRTSSAVGLVRAPRRLDVVALYVDPRGPYPELLEHWYDAERDARTYAGPCPVVAHPPCGPWGRLRFLCRHQDASLGPVGVEQVRAFGGILEHPAESRLFRACGMPFPGELPDAWGGRTYLVRQVAWGHQCEKPTWLYVVGVEPAAVVRGIRTGGVATHRVTSGPRGPQLPTATALRRRLTPRPFAEWLVSLAAVAHRSEAA